MKHRSLASSEKLVRRFGAVSALVLVVVFSGCAPLPPVAAQSALQVRATQTREYQVTDPKLVMKAVLDVLQDEGFVTKNAVVDLGLITATKEVDRASWASANLGLVLMGGDAVWEKTEVIEATANISEFGNEVRVRVSFQRKIMDNHGNVARIVGYSDPTYYQDFLVKVDKAIFIQKERL